MMDISNWIQISLQTLSKSFKFFKTTTLSGMKHKGVLALVVSLVCTIGEIVTTFLRIDYLPSELPLFFDWRGNVRMYANKELLWQFGINRTIIIVLVITMGYAVCRFKSINQWGVERYGRASKIVLRRIALLFLEIGMLLITTGTVFSMAMLGTSTKTPSPVLKGITFLFLLYLNIRNFKRDLKTIKLAQ